MAGSEDYYKSNLCKSTRSLFAKKNKKRPRRRRRQTDADALPASQQQQQLSSHCLAYASRIISLLNTNRVLPAHELDQFKLFFTLLLELKVSSHPSVLLFILWGFEHGKIIYKGTDTDATAV